MYAYVVLGLVFLYLVSFRYFNGKQQQNEPTLLRGWIPFVGNAISFARSPISYLRACRKEYGDIFVSYLAGKRLVFLLNSQDYNYIFKQTENFDMGMVSQEIALSVFKNVPEHLALITPDSKDLHKHFNSHLQGAALSEVTTKMYPIIQDTISKMDFSKYKYDLYEVISRCMFASSTAYMFGENFYTEEIFAKYLELDKNFPIIAAGVPVPGHTKVIEFLQKELHSRRNNVSQFVLARNKKYADSNLSEYDAQRFHISLMWASQANTIAATFWLMFYILRDGAVLKAVREEIESVMKGTDVLTREDLKKMKLLDSCMNESLRLSSSSMFIRTCTADTYITLPSNGQSYLIRKKDKVCMVSELHHSDPAVFPDHKEFKMDRFLQPEDYVGDRLSASMLHFGGGAHLCPGRFLAKSSMALMAALLLRRFDISIEQGINVPVNESRFGLGIPPPAKKVPYEISERVECTRDA